MNRSKRLPGTGVLVLATGLCLVAGIVEALPLQSCGECTSPEGVRDDLDAREAMLSFHAAPMAVAPDSRGDVAVPAARIPAGRSVDVQRLADRATGRTTIADAVTFGFDLATEDFLDLRWARDSTRGHDETKRISFPQTRTWGMGDLGTAPALRRR